MDSTNGDDLPRIEFAFPGPLRDELIAAIVSGVKTTTSSLLAEYEVDGEPLPVVGARGVVVDSGDRPLFVLETTGVEVVALADVPLEHAVGEGEGYESVAEWRAGHLRFWRSAELQATLGGAYVVGDDTLVVLERIARVGPTP